IPASTSGSPAERVTQGAFMKLRWQHTPVFFIAIFAIVLISSLLIGGANAHSPTRATAAPETSAQPIEFDRGTAALWQSLQKLHTRASLLMVTAHPDDEDGGMLTYESRGQGARVALLTLNRGEGGANVMSSDYFDALGLVRTEELL